MTTLASADTTMELSPMVVTTATRSEHDIETTPAPIQLIDQTEIEQMGATTLRDILELTPGIYLAPNGRQMQIRGLGHTDTVYLLNGRRIDGEFSHSYELERISATMIERIEILRGPASVLYGADALGGVINIITHRPTEEIEYSVKAQYGANSDGDGANTSASFDIRGGADKLGYSLYANALRRAPYAETETAQVRVPRQGALIPPSSHPNPNISNSLQDSYQVDVDYRDDAEVDTLGGELEYNLTDSLSFGVSFNLMEEERQKDYISSRYATNVMANGRAIQARNIPARWYDDNERLELSTNVDWALSNNLDLSYRLYTSRYEKDRIVYALPYADLGYASQEDSASSINQSTLRQRVNELTSVWRPAREHTLVSGLEHRNNKVDSTAFDTERSFKSAFVQHEWQLMPELNAVYGVRYDDDSVAGSHTSLQAGSVWQAAPLARLRINFAQGFKAPDTRTLYVDQVNPQGIPMLGAEVIDVDAGKLSTHQLDPEISETIEVGIAGGEQGWQYGLTLFHTEIEDRIETQRIVSGNNSYNSFFNIGEATLQGVEAEGQMAITSTLSASTAITRLKAENESTGETLLETPELLINLSLDYLPSANWLVQAIVSHTGEQDYSGSSGTETIDAYTLLHLKASYQLPDSGFKIKGGIDNLLDEEVDTRLGSDPGPYAYISLSYSN
jgi:outer membrane receptor for ferrienterochelin and colicins